MEKRGWRKQLGKSILCLGELHEKQGAIENAKMENARRSKSDCGKRSTGNAGRKCGTGKRDDVHYGKPPKRTNLSVSDLCVLELSVSVSSNLCVFFRRWNICFEISRPIIEPPFSLSWDSLSKPESEKTKHLQALVLCNCWNPSRLWRVEIAIRGPIFNLGFRDWEISDPGIQAGLRNLPLYYTYECKKTQFLLHRHAPRHFRAFLLHESEARLTKETLTYLLPPERQELKLSVVSPHISIGSYNCRGFNNSFKKDYIATLLNGCDIFCY